MDDMLNVSGHLLSTAEVESALVEHPDVAEAAVVSHPHAVKGECLYCFITPNEGATFTPKLVAELRKKGKFISTLIKWSLQITYHMDLKNKLNCGKNSFFLKS